MNQKGKEVRDIVCRKEENGFQGSYRMRYHLMPPVGWLNDPNGLCQFEGIYHVFFQYSPLDPNGGMKTWGHYQSRDLIRWDYLGTELFPDEEFDRDGVYSGSALVQPDGIYLYYTGNVKQEGEHDFTYRGREANTVLVVSPDGTHFGEKKLLMTNADYPADCTCHVRDPKVWQQGDSYYMVQGARKKTGSQCERDSDATDQGEVLLFSSKDKMQWSLCNRITTPERFGYMWECPDYFVIRGKEGEGQILSFSPQGLESEKYRFQNIYQSGYFLVQGDLTRELSLGGFTEWDMGFDFYAPQTFADEQGRRILIGWAGIPDADYDNIPSVEEGWQHCLTMPRELTWDSGKVFQNPVREMTQLRQNPVRLMRSQITGERIHTNTRSLELQLSGIKGDFLQILISPQGKEEGIELLFQNGVFTLRFVGQESNKIGRGRTSRRVRLEKLEEIHFFLDQSIIEIYINYGESVFTSRYYMVELVDIKITGEIGEGMYWTIAGYQVKMI